MSESIAELLFTAVRRFQHRQFQKAKQLHGGELNHAQWQLLVLLHRHPHPLGAKPSELARQQGVTAGNVTQQLRQLEDRQLIERVLDPDDRRVIRIKLNQQGNEVLQAAKQSMLQLFEFITEGLGEDKSIHLVRLLNQSADIIDDIEEAS